MLYNPKWEVKHKPASIEGLVAWLEEQDPTQRYDYYDHNCCLAAQYNKSIGRRYIPPNPWHRIDWEIEGIARMGKHTFGAALKRARECL